MGVSSTLIRKLCNSDENIKLREVIGIPKVSDYIIKNNLFKNAPIVRNETNFVSFDQIGLSYPRNQNERDNLFKTKFSSDQISRLLQLSGLIEPSDLVINHYMEAIGENGYSG